MITFLMIITLSFPWPGYPRLISPTSWRYLPLFMTKGSYFNILKFSMKIISFFIPHCFSCPIIISVLFSFTMISYDSLPQLSMSISTRLPCYPMLISTSIYLTRISSSFPCLPWPGALQKVRKWQGTWQSFITSLPQLFSSLAILLSTVRMSAFTVLL